MSNEAVVALSAHARWIGRDPDAVGEVEPPVFDDRPGITRDLHPPDLMRVEVPIQGVHRAELVATAKGLFRCWLDGERVGDDELAPGWTDYRVRVPVRRYDVTDVVAAAAATGRLCWAATIADGWYCGYLGMDRRRQACLYGTAPAFRAVLVIDAGSDVIHVGTDISWRRATGPIAYADLLMGQLTDLRNEPEGWKQVGFDDADWATVSARPDDVEMTLAVDPPVRTLEVRPAHDVLASPDGRFIVDFGANVAGRLRLSTAGLEVGTRIHMRHAEAIDDQELYTANLRTARAHDIVVSGSTVMDVESPFTIHGFRYAEITGHPGPAAAVAEAVRAVVVASDLCQIGSFQCSHEPTNRLHENVLRTIRGNTVAVPTDCPQRDERLGWMADTQLIAPVINHIYDAGSFFDQWLVAVRDGQSASGAFPDVAPKVVVEADGAPGWADAGILVPWAAHRHDADLDRLDRHYPAMVAFMDWLEGANPNLIRRHGLHHNYGDWLALGDRPSKILLATAYWALDAIVMARMAADLGRDPTRWVDLAERLRSAFANEFVDRPAWGTIVDQTSLALALAIDLVSDQQREQWARRLVESIESNGGALTTGIHGTRFLLPALADTGNLSTAYELLMRTDFPSWQHSIAHGATTVWERWDGYVEGSGFQTPAMNSMNHPALGSVAEWLHAYVAGLRPGSRAVQIRPYPGGGLSNAATATHLSGEQCAVQWNLRMDHVELRCTIPPRLRAEVHVPTVEPGASMSTCGRPMGHRAGWDTYEAGPGQWFFTAPWSPSWQPGDCEPGLLW
jgi:alpha-L-rhamnosidase